MKENDIIQQFFKRAPSNSTNPEIALGIGDDAAILNISDDKELVTSIDTLVNTVHFLPDTPAAAIGHKALAVSLSDMAAMGANPIASLLSITLPKLDQQWLSEFSSAYSKLSDEFHTTLIGGDLTHGPVLSISTVVFGTAPKGQAIKRSTAKPGDHIYVTGTLGDAGLVLDLLKSDRVDLPATLTNRLHYPIPRVAAGIALREIATAAIDLSDGIASDIHKLCIASECGYRLFAHQLPLSYDLRTRCDFNDAMCYALTAGDDYELCFTMPPSQSDNIQERLSNISLTATCVGTIVEDKNTRIILDEHNKPITLTRAGYEHFI